MAKSRKPKVRRGVFPDGRGGNTWYTILIQMPGRNGPVGLDELLDRLTGRGVIGASRRDVGADLHAGRIPKPAGKWGLLVALPGDVVDEWLDELLLHAPAISIAAVTVTSVPA